MDFFESNLFNYLVLPLFIVIARIFDVSLNTLRIIYLSKGLKNLVPILGFFEVLIWLLAVTRIFSDLNNWAAYIAYPLGFALGNFIGMRIEERLAVGVELIRIITRKDAKELIQALRSKGFSVTAIKAEGSQGEVGVLYSVINRKSIDEYVKTMLKYNPNAFYTVEDVRFVSKDVLVPKRYSRNRIKQTMSDH